MGHAGLARGSLGSPNASAGSGASRTVVTLLATGLIHAQSCHNLHGAGGFQLTLIQRGLDPESVDALFPYVTFALRDKRLDKDRDDYYAHPFLHRDLQFSPFWDH
jgi:hypothetical protein